jgi:hypothetical protein
MSAPAPERASAWLANLDADDELAAPAGYTPAASILARAAALLPRLAGLFRPGDVVFVEGGAPPEPGALGPGVSIAAVRGARLDPARFRARAWCPTPRAGRLFEAVGLAPPAGPPFDVLRRVNGRRFFAELGQALPGARYVERLDELEAIVAAPSPSGAWLCKREHGFAGRGRRVLAPGPLDDAARAWAAASLRDAGVQLEPLVRRTDDFALHGHVDAAGRVVLGAPTVQRCDERGAWLGSARAAEGELSAEDREALARAAEEAAAALTGAGYFGPFGVDGYHWLDAAGRPHTHARSELNARYSMGWAIGMGEAHPDLAGDAAA